MRKWVTAVAAAFATIIALVLIPAAGAAVTQCPSDGTPAPGTTIIGGLEVDGTCFLAHVTVKGGIVVNPSGEVPFPELKNLTLDGSHVSGGIVVGKRSWLSLGLDEFTGFLLRPSTVDGGITLNEPIWIDSEYAVIRGGVTANNGFSSLSFVCGPPESGCFAFSTFCGNVVFGDVTIRNNSVMQFFNGDPGDFLFANGECGGNAIHGSVFLVNSNFRRPTDGESNEIEGDTITGSVYIDHSTAEVFGNTIGGSLLCTNGSVMQPAPPGDPSGTTNSVRGANTCTG